MKQMITALTMVLTLSGCLDLGDDLPAPAPAPTPESITIEKLRNSQEIGDPDSVKVRNVYIAREGIRPIYCGQTTYIAKGGSWTGWTPFVAEVGAFSNPDNPFSVGSGVCGDRIFEGLL